MAADDQAADGPGTTGSAKLNRRRFLGGAALGVGLVVTAQLPLASRAAAATQPVYLDPTAPLDDRVNAILALMTDAQKLSSFDGIPAMTLADGFHLPAITSGGVEGLHGSGQNASATMFPQAIGFGSTWDTELLERIGHVVGFETRSRNANALRAFAPVVDTRSNPLAGRFEEGYGEDPFLCGTLGTAYAFGIKGRDPFYLLAKPEMKHFLAYDREWNRARASASTSCRAFHEFNSVAYKMPIVAGAVLGVMTAYTLINGVPADIGPMMDVARHQWAPGSFTFVPDAYDIFNLYHTKGAPYVYPLVVPPNADISYAAGLSPNPADDTTNRETTAALELRAGMTSFADFNSLGFNGATAAQGAVAAGILGVGMSEVDRVVRDWLAYLLRTGVLDGDVNPYNSTVIPPNPNPQNLQSSKDLALLAAQEQMVLLKNEHNLLPLDPARVTKLAVLGQLGDVNLRDYYSPKPPDSARVTPVQGITARLGADKVEFFNGTDTVAWESAAYGTFVTAPAGTAQMTADYTAGTASVDGGYQLDDGRWITPSQAFQIYDWGYDQHFFRSVATASYVNTDQAVVNNATQLRCSQSTMIDSNGSWNINANWHYLREGDGTRSIYGVDYIENDQFYRQFTTGRYVRAGTDATHALAPSLSYADFQSGGADVRASVQFREHRLESGTQRAATLAADADYAVVVVGNNVLVNARESQDRPGLALAPAQVALVHSVAAARPGRTIVVIVSSYPFAVKDIQDDPNVAAILYTSHAGQSAGTALASVLFGDYSPAGRLSATWLVDESSLPKLGPDADGHDPQYTVDMLEDDPIAAKLTYRYSEAKHIYPFGHGLSYGRFDYDGLRAPRSVDAERPFEVSFTITNSGRRTSDEVAQVYLHSRDSAYGRNVARTQLVGFQRVKAIAPGQTRQVTITVHPQDMFVWDPATQRTIVETGRYELMVGASSSDIRLDTVVRFSGSSVGELDLSVPRNAWEYYTVGQGVSHWEVSKANTLARNGGYHSVASRRDGDHIGFTKVALDGVSRVELRIATTTASWADVRHPAIDVRLDGPDGRLLGTASFAPTTGLQDFTTVLAALRDVPGEHRTRNLYLVFRSGGIYLDTVQLLR